MATLPIQTAIPATAPVFATASIGGDEFENNGEPFLLLTVPTPRPMVVRSPHVGLPDLTINLAAGGTISNRFESVECSSMVFT